MDVETIYKAKADDGLGLMSMKAHTIAIVGKTILGIAQDGESTLQCIMREKIGELSLRRLG